MDKKKVGIVCICLNPPYWQFANEMLWGLNTFFLKHPLIRDKYEVGLLLWSDIPESEVEVATKLAEWAYSRGELGASVVSADEIQFIAKNKQQQENFHKLVQDVVSMRQRGATVFLTEPIEWPMPTLMRYHLFLQQEEKLKEFDYIFYIDVDMRITDWIGEEVLGNGLTAAQHPMYALRQSYHPPYEPNPESSAYIHRPGRIIEENGTKRFEPLYFAGGFQGGKTEEFIKAMKVMRKNIDADFSKNYIARWNDESHWNKYLSDNPPEVVLSPSYIYPDSLIDAYYVKVWGRNYSPKIMTLTKKFTTNAADGQKIRDQLTTM